MTFSPEVLRRILAVLDSPTTRFVRLVQLAELDPANDLRSADLRAVNLFGENLAGFNITGADLTGADVRGADLRRTVGVYHATLTDVISDKDTKWPPLVRRTSIVNKRGLHARPAAKFANLAEQFSALVDVTCAGTTVSARSIMGLMMLGAGPGVELELRAEGPDAKQALDALISLIELGFGGDFPEQDLPDDLVAGAKTDE